MKRFLQIFLGLILLASPLHADIGIAARLADLEIENVPIGSPHHLAELGEKPFSVRNRSSMPVKARIMVRAPAPESLLPDYEPVPDSTWIQITPSEMMLKPGERAFAKVAILLPRNKRNLGRHFQATIIATTDGPGLVNASVENRLRFSTGPKPKRREWNETDTFVVEGASRTISIKDVLSEGPSVHAVRPVTVRNRSGGSLNLRCEAVPWNPAFSSMGFEPAPSPEWLKIRNPELQIARGRTGNVRLSMNIPKGTRIKGKNYVFLLAFYDVQNPRSRAFGRIFIKFK